MYQGPILATWSTIGLCTSEMGGFSAGGRIIIPIQPSRHILKNPTVEYVMHRLRLLLLLGLVLAVGGAPLAKAQDATSGLDQYKTVPPDTTHDKAKNENTDGHRKHWWSLPHLRHKKHDNGSAATQTGASSSSKIVAAKPVNKTVTAKPVSKSDAPTHRSNKVAAVTRPGHKTAAKTARSTKAAAESHPGRKTAASTGQGKKTVRHNCSPEEAKKGGCQAEKVHLAKGTTKQS